MTQKEMAVHSLYLLGICEQFVEKFRANGEVTVFDSLIGEDISNYPEVAVKIKEVETDFGCLVYAVTHECLTFGECYSFLVVSKYEEDWPHSLRGDNFDRFMAFSWVWNKTHEDCSEFGYVMLHSGFGGILRIS